jgi:hypothetical protein
MVVTKPIVVVSLGTERITYLVIWVMNIVRFQGTAMAEKLALLTGSTYL